MAPAGDPDRVEDVWDSPRWARLWDGLFYLTLAIPTVLTLAGGDGPVRSRAVTAALAAGFGAWYWAILVLHRDWWAGRRWPIVYLVVAAGFFWLLVARDSRYFILVYSLYPQVFGMLPDRWSYLGAAVVTVLPFAASGRLDHLEAGDLLSMVANLALALLVGLFIQAIAGQSERRREMIAELERARAENAALLARAREAAVLEERQRLAREIHDTLAQGLTGVVTQLEAAEAALQDRPEAAREHLDTARRLARESLGEARRSVNALRPGPLEQGRLVDAVAAVARGWSRASGVPATVTSVGQARPLPSETEVTLLRVAQEALANTGRHAAASAVALTLAFGDGQVSLDVTDDGVGFDPAAPPSGNGSGGYGLTAMRERVVALRGCLDVESGPGQGTTVVATIRALRERHPEVRVLVLTTFDTERDVVSAIEAGATGYLLKDAPRAELFRAVRAAARGETVLAPEVATRLVGQLREPTAQPLTQRELRVLELVARGATNREVATRLQVSEATVKTHLVHAFSKLGVSDRTAAVTAALERRLIRLDG